MKGFTTDVIYIYFFENNIMHFWSIFLKTPNLPAGIHDVK